MQRGKRPRLENCVLWDRREGTVFGFLLPEPVQKTHFFQTELHTFCLSANEGV